MLHINTTSDALRLGTHQPVGWVAVVAHDAR